VGLFDFLITIALLYVLYKLNVWWWFPRSSSKDSPRKEDWFDRVSEQLGEFIMLQWRAFMARRDKRNEYTDLNYKYWQSQFLIRRKFTARTLLGFKVEYNLTVSAKRIDAEEFKRHRMLNESARQSLAKEANDEFFLTFLDARKYFFSFNLLGAMREGDVYKLFSPTLDQLLEKDGSTSVREYASGSFGVELHEKSFKKKGCEVKLGFYRPEGSSDSLIEGNYAMLTEEQKEAILADENFVAFEEMLAVAALKRRLDFFGRASKQQHECDEFSVDVERAGPAVRIKWQFKERQGAALDLLGFRKTGGFFHDAWDEKNNGAMVIHESENNEIIEFPEAGQAHFYTLFMQWPGPDGSMRKSSAVRFQVTIAPDKEIESIETAIRRLEQRKPPIDPGKERLSRAINHLRSYVEFDNAFEDMGKSLEREIEGAGYPEAEKQEKLRRLREVMTQLRDDYQI
jgi:hypothetical protein